MIEIAPFLNDYYSDFLRRTDRFLTMQGARPADYAVGWQSTPTDRVMVVEYDETRFADGDYRAHILINGSAGGITIDTGLRMALGILRATFDQPENVAIARNLSLAKPGEMAAKLDPSALSFDDRSSGLLIDDHASPARLVNIEAGGERWALAESTSRRALEYVIFAIQYQANARVGQRFAALGNS